MNKSPRLSSFQLRSMRAIVQRLLQQALPIDSIQIAVGELNELNEDRIREQWIELVAQTPLAQTNLNIRIIRAEQQCMACFEKYHPQQKETACPPCGSVGAKILAGEEFFLEAIEQDD